MLTPDEEALRKEVLISFIEAALNNGYIRIDQGSIYEDKETIDVANFKVNIYGVWITLMYLPLTLQPQNSP